MTASTSRNAAEASLKRRWLSLIYELLILAALLLVSTLPVIILTHKWDHTIARAVLQIWLLVLCGVYFVWQWTRVGQTLPMKTWKLRVVARDGSPPTLARATLRYLLAVASTFLIGLGFLWALVDRDGQFLHDRLADTRIIPTDGNGPPA